MALKNSLIISYKGLTRSIICDLKFQYDDLLNIVADKFNIPVDYKMAIEFYDEQGNKYSKNTFEYFLLLFPSPKKIFFIRLDSTRIQTQQQQQQHSANGNLVHDDRVPFGKSKLNNISKQNNYGDTINDCEAVPVTRQNCFMGSWPSTTDHSQQQCSVNATEEMLALEIVERMRHLKQSPSKQKRIDNSNATKRCLRI